MVECNGLNVLVVGDSVGENMALFLANAHGDGASAASGDPVDLDPADLDEAALAEAGFKPVSTPSEADGNDGKPPRQVDSLGMAGMGIADRVHFASESNLEGRSQDKIWINEGELYLALLSARNVWLGSGAVHLLR